MTQKIAQLNQVEMESTSSTHSSPEKYNHSMIDLLSRKIKDADEMVVDDNDDLYCFGGLESCSSRDSSIIMFQQR